MAHGDVTHLVASEVAPTVLAALPTGRGYVRSRDATSLELATEWVHIRGISMAAHTPADPSSSQTSPNEPQKIALSSTTSSKAPAPHASCPLCLMHVVADLVNIRLRDG